MPGLARLAVREGRQNAFPPEPAHRQGRNLQTGSNTGTFSPEDNGTPMNETRRREGILPSLAPTGAFPWVYALAHLPVREGRQNGFPPKAWPAPSKASQSGSCTALRNVGVDMRIKAPRTLQVRKGACVRFVPSCM